MRPDAPMVVLVKAVVVLGLVLLAVPVAVWFERRVIAFLQDRVGPNRVGPAGILQPIADAVKLMFKENVIVSGADSMVYKLAPAFAMVPSLLAFIVIPFSAPTTFFGLLSAPTRLQVADLNIGFLFIFAASSLSVYGVCLGGWSSNNKWSLLGGMRSSAQMVSYEITLGLSVLGVLMISGTINLGRIVAMQEGSLWNWFVWKQPLAFALFVTTMFAETNRLPFDLPEAESELTGGYHTEYSSLRFALFFLGEYAAMFAMSALCITLFLGGYSAPALWNLTLIPDNVAWLWQLAWFLGKALAFLFLFVWVRGSWPRLRYDQLMALGWKVMLPLALLNLLLTAGVMALFDSTEVGLLPTAILFVVSVALLFWADALVTRRLRRGRRAA